MGYQQPAQPGDQNAGAGIWNWMSGTRRLSESELITNLSQAWHGD